MSGRVGAAPVSRRDFMQNAGGVAMLAAASGNVLAKIPEILPAVWKQGTDRKIRIGVVGGRFGLSFQWHEHPNCEVVAVSDLIPKRLQALQQRYACERPYESLEKLVLDPAVEAVAIFTGAPDHARHVQLCMDHGKHVISAVPACLTLEDAHAMKLKKEKTGLRYMMAETTYYRRHTMMARRLHRDGAFGDLIYCEAEYYHPSDRKSAAHRSLAFYNGERTWRYGYPPMLYPTHSTAFLVGVTGERLVRVSCIGHRSDDADYYGVGKNVYDNPFDSGMGMFLTDKGNPFRCNVSWQIRAHGERAQWFGDKGAMYAAGSGGQPTRMTLPGKTLDSLPTFWESLPEPLRHSTGHGNSHTFLTHEFISALLEDREPAIDIYEALAYTVPGIVAHQSSLKDGEQMAIPSLDPA